MKLFFLKYFKSFVQNKPNYFWLDAYYNKRYRDTYLSEEHCVEFSNKDKLDPKIRIDIRLSIVIIKILFLNLKNIKSEKISISFRTSKFIDDARKNLSKQRDYLFKLK